MPRRYFEKGCRCILEGAISKAPDHLSPDEVEIYYLQRCKCSRSYLHEPYFTPPEIIQIKGVDLNV